MVRDQDRLTRTAEERALREVGRFLGSAYRADLVTRLGEGKLDAEARAGSRDGT
jgi:hypothetical protein